MPQFVRGFVIPDVANVHVAFQKLIADLDSLVAEGRRLGVSVGTFARDLADVRVAYRDFQRNLRSTAEQGAVRATKDMRERLQGDRRRPATGSTPTLESLVEAQPLGRVGGFETGAVGVANVELLNRAVNPHSRGYGPYWRAQEYGTGQHGVPSQVGRILYGSFMEAGGGNPTPPMSEFAGGGGPHPVFVSARGRTGMTTSSDGQRTVGLGTIGHEIPAKHFIQYGADAAAVQWRAEIAAVQARALDQLGQIRLGRS